VVVYPESAWRQIEAFCFNFGLIPVIKLSDEDKRQLQHISVPKICSLLDCPKSTVYELIQGGELEAIRIGRATIRVRKESFERFLERSRVTSIK